MHSRDFRNKRTVLATSGKPIQAEFDVFPGFQADNDFLRPEKLGLKKVDEIEQAAKQDPKHHGPLLDALQEPDCKVDGLHKKMKATTKQIEDAKAAKAAIKAIASMDPLRVFHEDFRSGCAKIPDSSVALIFTDPPYDRQSLPLFASLADTAERVLAGHPAAGPGGCVKNLGSHELMAI